MMTQQQINLVQHSFELVKPIAQIAGELFYQKLFAAAPQVRHMFKTPTAEQAGKLMYTLGYVINNLHTPDVIMENVQKLGARHQGYGAQPEHYELVGSVLLDTLAEAFAENWTNELRQAWATAYAMVANAMMQAQHAEKAA